MKKYIFLAILMTSALHHNDANACTNLIAGKGATSDGSVMVTYAADSHQLYGELYYYPAADHKKGSMREVREWDSHEHRGYIPEAAHTYSVVGNMNEHQLLIAESTFGGRHELINRDGIIDYGSLIYITLQRAKTAREAIKVMTDLVAEHGYCSSGESFSIADPNEVWVMEMVGRGPKEKGALWVAVRIPDDCISGHANHSRIHKFPLNDPENCIYCPDLISWARKNGYYSGDNDADFSFSFAFGDWDYSSLRGCDARVWAYYNMYADGMERYFNWCDGDITAEILPLYVKPNRKLTVDDLKAGMRDHFENTPFDMTKDVGAGPWNSPYRFRPLTYDVDGITYTHERAIATQQTAFVFVGQVRNWLPNEIGGILWFGVDDAATTVFIPMYCSMTEIPHSYAVGTADLLTLNWESAFWVNNFVANQAYDRYYSLMFADIEKVQKRIEGALSLNQPEIEAKALQLYKTSPKDAAKYLNDYSVEQAEKATKDYKALGEYLLVKYLDGNVKVEDENGFAKSKDGNPAKPKWPGYDNKYYRNIVKETGNHFRVKEVKDPK